MKIRDVILVAAGVILLSVSATAEEKAASPAPKQAVSAAPASPAKEKKASGKKEKSSARPGAGKDVSSGAPQAVKTPLPSKEEVLRVLDTMLKNIIERKACVEAAADQTAVAACVQAAPTGPAHPLPAKPKAADKQVDVPQEGKPAAESK